MQVTELLALTEWMKLEIREKGVVGLYEQLQTKLQQNAQGQAQQPFEEEKDNLVTALGSVRLQTLTTEQVRFLDCIGIGEHVGGGAVELVEDILFRNPLDPATAASKLQEIIESINAGINRSERLAEGLEGCVAVDEALGDDVLIRVRFSGDAAINNVVDLKKWSEIWHGIVRGIAMAHGHAPVDVRVIGASQGSLLFDLAAPEAFAVTTMGIVFAALRVAEKVVHIQKKAQEVKSLKLTNKKIAGDLETEAKKAQEGGVEEVTAEFTAKLKLDSSSGGDVITALNKSINDLIQFVRRGGEVDCVLPDQTEEDAETENKERQQLRTTLKEIRELEGRLRQLGSGVEGEPTDDSGGT